MNNERIRKAAKALIKELETFDAAVHIRNWHIYKELKESVGPSRKEIADYLEHDIETKGDLDAHHNWLGYAIEELRSEDDK